MVQQMLHFSSEVCVWGKSEAAAYIFGLLLTLSSSSSSRSSLLGTIVQNLPKWQAQLGQSLWKISFNSSGLLLGLSMVPATLNNIMRMGPFWFFHPWIRFFHFCRSCP